MKKSPREKLSCKDQFLEANQTRKFENLSKDTIEKPCNSEITFAVVMTRYIDVSFANVQRKVKKSGQMA